MTFAELLRQPDLVTHVSWRDLHNWSQTYPYTQGLHLLIVRKAQQDDNPDLQVLLERAATYLPNRRFLYHFLQKNFH